MLLSNYPNIHLSIYTYIIIYNTNKQSIPLLYKMIQSKPSPFNSSLLKKAIKMKILNQTDTIPPPRCIYGDSNIIQTINFVYDFKFEIEGPSSKIYTLEYDHQATDVDNANNVIFFLYPNPNMIDVIASMIIKNQLANVKKNYYVYFVPMIDYLCMQRIQQKQIKNKITIKNFNFDLIPINQDLFSLQLSNYLDPLQQNSCILQSMLKLSKIVGKIKNNFAFGTQSTKMLNKLQQTLQTIPEMQDAGQQYYMIILDRALDYVTPMITPFSYEGLLDLFFGIKFNKIQIPGSLMNSNKPLQTFLLYNPNDRHYKTIAPMYIRQVPQYLKKYSQELSTKIKQKKQLAKTIEDINQIQQQLMPELLILQYHKSIAAFLLTHINQSQFFNTATMEAEIIQTCQRPQNTQYLSVFYPIQQVLKLQILSSQVSNFSSYFQKYEKKIYQNLLNSYHPRHIITIKNTVQRGIMRSSKQPLKWKQICQKLDLIPDQPRCYTYIHTIYSALLVRFIEMFLTDNINLQTMNLLTNDFRSTGNFKKIRSGDYVYIYVIGGITYSEIQGFRLLGKKLGLNFVYLTTQITSGQKIIKKCFN